MKLNGYIDHTLLKPETTEAQIRKLAEEAIEYEFCSCCVNTCYVPLTHELLKNSPVKTCCVVGFPLGAMSTEAKINETVKAIADGADEVDMVINVGALKDRKLDYVREEINDLKQVVGNRILKVIIETCLLTDEEKTIACELAVEAGADFVKTSTGFSSGGAVVEDVRLMRETVGAEMGVKASGGIRSRADAEAMVAAGATRLGTSSGVKIVAG